MNRKKSPLKSSYAVSIMTVLSRIAGLARETIFANIFGAGSSMDAFLVAFRIPSFLRRLFAEGAFSQAFVPVLSEYRQLRGEEETKTFINRMYGNLSVVLFAVTAIAILLSPLLVIVFAPGFIHNPNKLHLAASMLRVTFPYLIFISLTAFGSAVLNSYDIFSVPAITPILLNLSMIIAAIFLSPHFAHPVKALAWGVFLGGIVQMLFQFPFLKRLRLLPSPKIFWRDEGVRRVIKMMAPAILGVSVAQISILIDTLFASFLHTGSITWLYFSDRLANFPLGVFGIAIATVILPHLSRKHATKSPEEFSASIDWALRCILIIGIPAAIGLFLLSGPIISTILEHGQFKAFDVRMASRSLMAFSLGLPAFMLIKVLATGFYSQQDIRTPVRIAITALIANMVLNLILIFPLAHAGLALATTLASSINAGLLLYILKKRKAYVPQKGWWKYGLKLGFANAALVAFLLMFAAKLPQWLAWSWQQRIFHLLPLLLGAVIVYIGFLYLAGIRWRDFKLQYSE